MARELGFVVVVFDVNSDLHWMLVFRRQCKVLLIEVCALEIRWARLD